MAAEQHGDLFQIRFSRPMGGVCLLTLAGELDISTAPTLMRRLAEIPATPPAHVVVDLSGLGFIDSSGINTLVGAARVFRQAGGELILAAPGSNVERVFEMVRLGDLIAIEKSLESALLRAEAVPGGNS